MGKHRNPYPAEFRAQMVELVKAGRTPEELAREFEPTAQSIITTHPYTAWARGRARRAQARRPSDAYGGSMRGKPPPLEDHDASACRCAARA